jgi:hypothetical protein
MDVEKAASARDHLALMREQVFGDVPAAIERSDQVFLRDRDVFEECLTERRPAIELPLERSQPRATSCAGPRLPLK